MLNFIGRFIAAVATAATLVPLPIAAQVPNDVADLLARVRQYATAGARTLRAEVLPKIRQKLPTVEQSLLDSVDFRFPADVNAMLARAYKSAANRPIIEISGGHLMLMVAAIDTNLLGHKFGKEREVSEYLVSGAPTPPCPV